MPCFFRKFWKSRPTDQPTNEQDCSQGSYTSNTSTVIVRIVASLFWHTYNLHVHLWVYEAKLICYQHRHCKTVLDFQIWSDACMAGLKLAVYVFLQTLNWGLSLFKLSSVCNLGATELCLSGLQHQQHAQLNDRQRQQHPSLG